MEKAGPELRSRRMGGIWLGESVPEDGKRSKVGTGGMEGVHWLWLWKCLSPLGLRAADPKEPGAHDLVRHVAGLC